MIYGSSDGSPLVNLYRLALPFRTNRDEYIGHCRATNTVSIKNESGIQHNVRFPVGMFPHFHFPFTPLTEGSLVAVNRLPRSPQLYIVAVYPPEGQLDNTPIGGTSVAMDGVDSSASIVVEGSGCIRTSVSAPERGRIEVSVEGEGSTHKTSVDGDIISSATRSAQLYGTEIIHIAREDGFIQIAEESTNIEHPKEIQFNISTDDGVVGSIKITAEGIEVDAKDGLVTIKNGERDTWGTISRAHRRY